MATIKKGTYRFNDELTQLTTIHPETGYNEVSLPFTFTADLGIEGYENTVFTCSTIYQEPRTEEEIDSNGVGSLCYTAVASTPDLTPLGFTYPLGRYVWSPTDGWELIGAQTITITEDTEVSDEFSTWFTANAVSLDAKEETPLATISYNGTTIASINCGQKATLKCKGMTMADYVLVEVAEQTGGGGSDANIVPLLVGHVGTYDANSPVLVTETFTGGGDPDAIYSFWGYSFPFFKAKKMVATRDIVNLVKNEELSDRLYINLFGNIIPLWQMEWNETEECFWVNSGGYPAVVWVFDIGKDFTQEMGFEVGGVYILDTWSLMGATGEASLTALGIPDKPIDGFTPVEVAIPYEDKLVIEQDYYDLERTQTMDGGYFGEIVMHSPALATLSVTPSTKKQTFSYEDKGRIPFSHVTVEAVDLTQMALMCDIELESLPKTEYELGGGRLDTTGGVILRRYTNGTIKRVNLTNQDVSGWEKVNGVGTYTYVVTYTENGITCRTTYDITVTE